MLTMRSCSIFSSSAACTVGKAGFAEGRGLTPVDNQATPAMQGKMQTIMYIHTHAAFTRSWHSTPG